MHLKTNVDINSEKGDNTILSPFLIMNGVAEMPFGLAGLTLHLMIAPGARIGLSFPYRFF